ncbi:1-phosphofructokinase family hexose kinase [Brevibacterium casei]|uniref:Tagatose-6-phosphate kinase n=1 Tax=Brevibacterium casei TaxID=33889 RepID=A0A449DBG5_9MICO|nr:PfkB family carbohydrate kinase [Brevibacterium casei]VEW14917.1 Tagatose-6-phosphate kinase [Brevibacterium casei]
MTVGTARADTDAPVVAVLTLSPALDLTVDVGELTLGRSHRVAPAAEVLGGKGVNVARVLAALGVPVVALGPVAREHWPEEASGEAGHSSVLTWDLTPTSAPLRRSIAVVEDSGRATLVNESGHPHTGEVWEAVRAGVRARLTEQGLRVLVISGSTPPDCPDDLVPGLIASAHAAGVEVVVDTSGPALLAAVRAGADWVKPNDDEIAALFARDGRPDRASAAGDLLADAGRLVDAGAGHVLLSLGEAGMVLIDDQGPRLRARLDETLHGNPTGAGDAAVAALAWVLSERPPTEPVEGPTGQAPAALPADPAAGSAPRSRTGTVGRLGEDEVRDILTRAVAVSAAAVLMPQAGQIPENWRDLRARVLTEDATTKRSGDRS